MIGLSGRLLGQAAPNPVPVSHIGFVNAADVPSAPEPHQIGDAGDPKTSPAAAPQSQRDRAEEQLRREEHQRILGIIPNFNTTDIQDAAPLSPKQKFHLMFHSVIDPFEFVAAGAISGFGQATDSHAGYGQGAAGYGKRYGAAYADSADGAFWGNAVLPSLLHQDPRYFRMGHGTFWSRLKYSVLTTVRTRNDNGTHGPNYSNLLGNLISGGISNLYYPAADRGVGLTFQGAAIVTGEGAIGSLAVEFWPDVSRKLLHTPHSTAIEPAAK